ncbi:MAG: hypothetical protein PUD20_03310 [bacterium]|nr:hypothetical protein [bacterium]
MFTERNQLYIELQAAVEQGIVLFLDGDPCSPAYVTHTLCANEDACYMRDYVFDEKGGKLKELRFDRLSSM